MLIEILLAIVLFCAWFYHYVTKQFDFFKKRGIPFAKPSFPYGSKNAAEVLTGKTSFFHVDKLLAESEEFKNEKVFGYFMMGQPNFVINDEEIAKRVMVKDFDHFSEIRHMGYKGTSKENKLYHHMLTSLPGDEWKKVRALLTPCFSGSKLKLMLPYLKKVGAQLCEYVSKHTGEEFDARDLFSKYSLDGLASAAYGIELNSFEDPDSVFRKTVLTLAGAPGYGSPWDIPRFILQTIAPSIAKLFKLPMFPEKPCLFVANVVEQAIKQRKESGAKRNDFIDLALEEMKGELGQSLSQDEKELIIVANLLVLFFVGFDSTSISLGQICQKLIVHPEVQDKLLEEIDSVLAEEDEIEWETFQKIPYLDQVILESLRHENIQCAHERLCTKDYKIPDTEITIPKGRHVKIYFGKFENSEKNFVNPHKFDPENFNPENNYNKFAAMAFSQGPRNCIGYRYAMTTMKISLLSLLRRHRVVASEKTNLGKLELDPQGIFEIKGGIYFKTEERK